MDGIFPGLESFEKRCAKERKRKLLEEQLDKEGVDNE